MVDKNDEASPARGTRAVTTDGSVVREWGEFGVLG